MSKQDEAMALFNEGANCAQAVLGAFAKECNLTKEEAFKLASGFGGGFARLREVCGAASGMALVINILYGNSDIKNKEAKDNDYARLQKLLAKFKAETGSIICKELLAPNDAAKNTPTSDNRTKEYYKKRPCSQIVGIAASIVEEFLQENK
jgi:C_GCAxxG_C_C family probable redox protein